MTTPRLDIADLQTHFLTFRGTRVIKAVDGVSFALDDGETLGLVGESGCSKTTTCLAIVGLLPDPYSSLSPRMRVGDIIGEPLEIHTDWSRQAIGERVGEVLELVGLNPDMAVLFPHEFSGGQRQRVAIARALAAHSRLIVLDEPGSALDVSIRAQMIRLLEHLQHTLGMSFLFIGHDLATVAHISQRIAVMYLGKIIEVTDSQGLCANPLHPYTKALFAAALPAHPDEAREGTVITGEVPSALNPPSGCHFHPRCPYAMPHCAQEEPVLTEIAPHHAVACHLY